MEVNKGCGSVAERSASMVAWSSSLIRIQGMASWQQVENVLVPRNIDPEVQVPDW